MPLIGDSKSVYVGTTPITKVMAAGVQVWPKVDPLLTQFKTDKADVGQGQYVAWEHKFTDCETMLTRYKCRYGFAANTDGTGAITWQPYYDLGDCQFYFYSPSHEALAWCSPYTRDNEWDALARYVWSQVLDSTTGKTIVNEHFDRSAPYVPRPADAIDCRNALPIDTQLLTDVPGVGVRNWVSWDNQLSIDSCIDLRGYKVYEAFSDSPDGSVEPPFWGSPETLDKATYKMIWPTYNAILWSPIQGDAYPDLLHRLWFKVTYGTSSNPPIIIPPTQINLTPPTYAYPTGDSITC